MIWVKAPGLFVAAIDVSQHYNAHWVGFAVPGNTLRNCFLAALNHLVPSLSGQVTVNFEDRLIKLSLRPEVCLSLGWQAQHNKNKSSEQCGKSRINLVFHGLVPSN